MTTTRLRIGTFGGASAFPLRVAQARDLFAGQGLEVDLEQTTDSDALRAGLADGRLDIVHLAPDNVLAWRDGGGSHAPLAVRAWVVGSNGPIALLARDATTITGLRGRRIGVDAPGSGFAPILRRLLAGDGLREADVELVALGATRRRAEALTAGSIDATMLTLPWSRLAEDSGAVRLADHRAVAPGLLTSCGASLDAWLAADADRGAPPIVSAYRAALDAAVAWLRDPASTAAATMLLSADIGIETTAAEGVLAAMRDPSVGWPEASAPVPGALDAVWRLRAEAVATPAADPDTYLWLGRP